ncbi:MAG: polysaccharide biosynthesis tyrosine autokinase [Chloroflexi bacterium]|nr:polysaccharide biosynthesis tyrosine autokinase [Chloroflexota bacterium]
MNNNENDIRTYLALVRRWWWVLVLGALVGSLAALFASRSMTPIYTASAKIFVQPGRSYQPNAGDIQSTRALVEAYSALIKTRPVLEKVIERLHLPYTPETLAGLTSIVPSGSLIIISASVPDPDLAATIADATSKVFIDDFQQQQLLELARLQSSLQEYGIADNSLIISAQATTLNTLRIVEQATPPFSPTSPDTRTNVLLGMFVGLALAGGLVFLLERLDDTVKSPDDMRELTGLATLGSVFRTPPDRGGIPVTLTDEHQRSSLSESFKFLSASLDFATAGTKDFKTVMMTSSSPSEGKTTTAANLALALARQGKSVILVDTDLRKPQIHRIFGRSNGPGFTNVVLGTSTLEEVLAPTEVPNLRLVLSGPMPPDPTQVLRLPRVKEVLRDLAKECDIVIMDSPPVMVVADSMILASMVDGIVFVVDAHRTSRNAIAQGVEMLRQTPTTLLGAVMNKVQTRGRGRYYYYYYYYTYYYSYSGDSANGNRRRRAQSLAGKIISQLTFGALNVGSRRQRRRGYGYGRSRESDGAASTNGANGSGEALAAEPGQEAEQKEQGS